MALGLAFVVWQVTTAGSWLDEFWQLWISGAPANLLPARLAADAHPPWFNLLARPIVLIKAGVVATPNGAVLLISPADRLHRHP